jgi:hypothetical protein
MVVLLFLFSFVTTIFYWYFPRVSIYMWRTLSYSCILAPGFFFYSTWIIIFFIFFKLDINIYMSVLTYNTLFMVWQFSILLKLMHVRSGINPVLYSLLINYANKWFNNILLHVYHWKDKDSKYLEPLINILGSYNVRIHVVQ